MNLRRTFWAKRNVKPWLIWWRNFQADLGSGFLDIFLVCIFDQHSRRKHSRSYVWHIINFNMSVPYYSWHSSLRYIHFKGACSYRPPIFIWPLQCCNHHSKSQCIIIACHTTSVSLVYQIILLMAEILHQIGSLSHCLQGFKNILGGAGFLPSTVPHHFHPFSSIFNINYPFFYREIIPAQKKVARLPPFWFFSNSGAWKTGTLDGTDQQVVKKEIFHASCPGGWVTHKWWLGAIALVFFLPPFVTCPRNTLENQLGFLVFNCGSPSGERSWPALQQCI